MMRLYMPIGLAMMIITCLTGPCLVLAGERNTPITITPERALEAESPEYRAMSDQQRVAMIAQWAKDKGGYDAMMLSLIKSIAGRNNLEALYVLGMIYTYPSWRAAGLNLKKDEKGACIYFGLAAEQGHPYALQEYALCFLDGRGGVNKDKDKALKWFEKAAGTNYTRMAYSQYMAGAIYLDRAKSSGNKQDRDKGIAWLKKSADNGNKDASRLLRRMGAESKKPPGKKPEETPSWLKPVETE